MDGPSEASPPMSAPLLLWVILLHWAIGGGFNRGGRTWQHCTGRSEGRRVGGLCREGGVKTGVGCAGETHWDPCAPTDGMFPALPGQTPDSVLHFGGDTWLLQGAPRGAASPWQPSPWFQCPGASGLSLGVTAQRNASGAAAASILPATVGSG